MTVIIEGGDANPSPGASLHGRVEVKVDADMSCGELVITAEWSTRGNGLTDRGEGARAVLGPFQWRRGETASHAFDITLPLGPVSYDGRLFRVEWFMVATATLQGGGTIRAQTPFRFDAAVHREKKGYRDAPLAKEQPLFLGPDHRSGLKLVRKPSLFADTRVLLAGLALLVATGWVTVAGGFSLLSILCLLVTTAALALAMRRVLRKRRWIQGMSIEVVPDALRAGESFQMTLRIAKGFVVGDRGSIVFRGREVVVGFMGERTHVIHYGQGIGFDQSSPHPRPHEPRFFSLQKTVPPGAAPSFASKHNRLEWVVLGEFTAAHGMQWRGEYVLTVQPGEDATEEAAQEP